MKDFISHQELTNDLNTKYPKLNLEVVSIYGNLPSIKTPSSSKAKILREMFFGQGYRFSF